MTLTCPICSSVAGNEFQAKYVQAAQCLDDSCEHIFAINAAPMHGVQVIEEQDEVKRTFHARDMQLMAFLKRRGFLKPGMRVLDFGAGIGHISQAVREAVPFTTLACIEADPTSSGRLKLLGLTVHSSLDEVENQVDAILLVEVIEHLDDPVAIMKALVAKLGPFGKIFLTTPCGQTRSGSRATNAYDTPEHVQFFTEKSLEKCLNRAGLTIKLETVNAMTSVLTKPPVRHLKDFLRPIRAAIQGHSHLTGFVQPTFRHLPLA